jgi:hypothetical protein
VSGEQEDSSLKNDGLLGCFEQEMYQTNVCLHGLYCIFNFKHILISLTTFMGIADSVIILCIAAYEKFPEKNMT